MIFLFHHLTLLTFADSNTNNKEIYIFFCIAFGASNGNFGISFDVAVGAFGVPVNAFGAFCVPVNAFGAFCVPVDAFGAFCVALDTFSAFCVAVGTLKVAISAFAIAVGTFGIVAAAFGVSVGAFGVTISTFGVTIGAFDVCRADILSPAGKPCSIVLVPNPKPFTKTKNPER